MDEYWLPSHHKKYPIPYPKIPPIILAILQIIEKYNAFFRAPRAKAINNTSGGMGKNEDSANANTNRAIGPYGVFAQ